MKTLKSLLFVIAALACMNTQAKEQTIKFKIWGVAKTDDDAKLVTNGEVMFESLILKSPDVKEGLIPILYRKKIKTDQYGQFKIEVVKKFDFKDQYLVLESSLNDLNSSYTINGSALVHDLIEYEKNRKASTKQIDYLKKQIEDLVGPNSWLCEKYIKADQLMNRLLAPNRKYYEQCLDYCPNLFVQDEERRSCVQNCQINSFRNKLKDDLQDQLFKNALNSIYQLTPRIGHRCTDNKSEVSKLLLQIEQEHRPYGMLGSYYYIGEGQYIKSFPIIRNGENYEMNLNLNFARVIKVLE